MAAFVEKSVQGLIGDFYQAHAAGDQAAMDVPLEILKRKIFENSLDSQPFIEYYNDMFSGRTSFNALISVKDYPFESIFRELLQNTFDCYYDTADVKLMVNFKENNEISLAYNEIGFTMEHFLYYLAFGRNKIDKYKEGRFGVGAKSVFMNVQWLTMRSNRFSFKIENRNDTLEITELDLLRKDLKRGTEITIKVSTEQYERIKENYLTLVDKKGDFINLVELCFAFNRKKVMNIQEADVEEKDRTFNIAVMEKDKVVTLYKIAYVQKDGADNRMRTIRFLQNNKSVADFICHEKDGFCYLIPFAVTAAKRQSIVRVFMQKYNYFSTYELTGLLKAPNDEAIIDEKLSAFFISVPNEYITMYRTGIKADSELIVAEKVEQGLKDLIESYGEYFVLDAFELPGIENRYGLRPKSYAFEFIKNFVMSSKLARNLKTNFQESISIQFPGEKKPATYAEIKEAAYLQSIDGVTESDHNSGTAYNTHIVGERDNMLAQLSGKGDKTLYLAYEWESQDEKKGREFYYEFIRKAKTYIVESRVKPGLPDYNLYTNFKSVVGLMLNKYVGEGNFIEDEDALESVFSFFDQAFNEDYKVNMRYYQLYVTRGDEQHTVDISKVKIGNLKNAMETLMTRRHRFDTSQAYNETTKMILNVFTQGKDTITFLREIKAQGGQITLALDINKKYRFSAYGNQFLIPGRTTNAQMLEIVGDIGALISAGMLNGRKFDFPITQGKYSFDANVIAELLKSEDVTVDDVNDVLPRLFVSDLKTERIALLGAGDKILDIIDVDSPIPENHAANTVRLIVLTENYSKAEFADIIEQLILGENKGLISASFVRNVEPNIVLPDQMPFYNRPIPEVTRAEFDYLRSEIRRLKKQDEDEAAAKGETKKSVRKPYRNFFAKDVNCKLFGYGGCCPVCGIEIATINSFAVKEFLVELVSTEDGREKERVFKFALYMCANDSNAAGGWVIEDVSIGGMSPFLWVNEITAADVIVPEFLHCSIRMTTRVTYEVPADDSVASRGKAFATPQTAMDFVLSPLMAAKWVEDNSSE
jgi:hypothetical protein